ncbi:hypothetical protein [Fructobacillus ficulneus]|uniref:AttH domain-containing protein n=1 Tax=Fructobacillus ficulneus TaxID=157463 RepID=A0A0K8MIN5_9LACO|nr:hypothetical protein [Fructobacillus ficulneus]GAP00427.1 hypothetical protein FFIC_284440 [Fructobacillus ficulneus]
MATKVRLADEAADFAKVGLDKNHIVAREDGERVDPDGENYEWWYFDANLNDGSQLVTTFYAKSVVNPSPGLKPSMEVEWTKADGTAIKEKIEFKPEDFSASKDTCDVKMGKNYFRGDLHHYEIGIFGEKIQVEISFDNITPAWRPNLATFYGDQEENNFSWLPATPRGHAQVKLTANGQTQDLEGDCYHDHNWGDVALMKVMNHWYWGRANIGDYTVIDSYMTTEKKYGHAKVPVFLLAKREEILADDVKYVTYTQSDREVEPVTGKPYYKNIVFDYNDQKNHYRVTYSAEKVITHDKMIDQIDGFKKFMAKMIGFDGAYLRFSGIVKLEILNGEEVTESFESKGLWEEAYFGKTID